MTEEELKIQTAILMVENQKLKKENRELKHTRMLDQAEIIGLRRQIEMLVIT